MARNLISCDHADEDYIDMEISSSTFFCYSITSPPQPRDFEFQMCSGPLERETITSPADELFYKGKLLPLQLPPRLQMVQKLLHNSKTDGFQEESSSYTPTTTSFSTPLESCNISPSDSCRVSGELNPEEYFFDCSNEIITTNFNNENPKKSWSRKLRLIKQSSLGMKLKASRAYLKSLFGKSGCADESCAEAAAAAAARNGADGTVSKAKECLYKYMKAAKKNPSGQIHRERQQMQDSATKGSENDKEKVTEDSSGGGHRRSFSGAIKRCSATKSSFSSSSSSCSSGSSSFSLSTANSSGFYDLHLLRRSSSANSEIENSIQGAIAHCKQSQQLFRSRKTSTTEIGFCSLSTSKVAACEDQERSPLCRG